MRPLSALFFIALLLSSSWAALGLKTMGECDDPNNLDMERDSARMQCYYAAGITEAYLCGMQSSQSAGCPKAIIACNSIWTTWGEPNIYGTGSKKDLGRKAELVSNTCFYDIAKITRHSPTCDYITEHRDPGTALTGEVVTLEMCREQADNLARLANENYYSPNKDNICSVASFVLPLTLLGAILSRYP
ncbi:MAG: hypothetical protein V1827_04565 [Candidatus Micrarchaeota archaeon]